MFTGVDVGVGSGIGVSVSAGAKVGVPVHACVGFGVLVSVGVSLGFGVFVSVGVQVGLRVGVVLSFVGFSVGLPISFVGVSVAVATDVFVSVGVLAFVCSVAAGPGVDVTFGMVPLPICVATGTIGDMGVPLSPCFDGDSTTVSFAACADVHHKLIPLITSIATTAPAIRESNVFCPLATFDCSLVRLSFTS